MNPRDPRASLEVDTARCRWCEEPFPIPPAQLAHPPRYCSAPCRKAAHALRESERRTTLRGAGLCPCCKGPLRR